jgi:hypothetical protein
VLNCSNNQAVAIKNISAKKIEKSIEKERVRNLEIGEQKEKAWMISKRNRCDATS